MFRLTRPNLLPYWLLPVAVLWSALLLFQVQPLISKTILPWFGGSPTVWTTCMLFFQVALFGGYLYAHLLATLCSPRWQAVVHVSLMLGALCLLPIAPSETWKPTAGVMPGPYILLLLLTHLGLPYFLLSANGPLLQHWFTRLAPGKSPYRLYALSNVGSLLALLSYPFVVEPNWTLPLQSTIWSWGYAAFALLLVPVAWGVARSREEPTRPAVETQPSADDQAAPTGTRLLAWLLLPAFACLMLLATTNHVCQDMAVVPFLWVVPLSLYLLTFIFCFDAQAWYRRGWIGWMAIGTIGVISLMEIVGGMLEIAWVAVAYFAAMFFVCMICHGELVRLKPAPRYLTLFYLTLSAGGALGGLFVSLACPLLFSQYYEMPLGLITGFALALGVVVSEIRQQRQTIPLWNLGLLFAGLLVMLSGQLRAFQSEFFESHRNFYGVLNLKRLTASDGTSLLAMYHGRIMHGFQFENPERRQTPTSYYARNTGVGLALTRLPERARRIGVVGLGAGTLATYGRPGDTFRFYEINPDVIRLAEQRFTFLADSPADVELVLGDARLSLETEDEQRFDLLVLDAFSGDAIPTHLLTREAFEIYRRHLAPGGVLAVHISNKHLDLKPVVAASCAELQLDSLYIASGFDKSQHETGAQWILATTNRQFLADDTLQSAATQLGPQLVYAKPWTDNFSNLLEVLK